MNICAYTHSIFQEIVLWGKKNSPQMLSVLPEDIRISSRRFNSNNHYSIHDVEETHMHTYDSLLAKNSAKNTDALSLAGFALLLSSAAMQVCVLEILS